MAYQCKFCECGSLRNKRGVIIFVFFCCCCTSNKFCFSRFSLQDHKLKHMADLQQSVVTDPETRHQINQQILQWEENLERLHCEQFRLRCYMASLQSGELPNPKVRLTLVYLILWRWTPPQKILLCSFLCVWFGVMALRRCRTENKTWHIYRNHKSLVGPELNRWCRWKEEEFFFCVIFMFYWCFLKR